MKHLQKLLQRKSSRCKQVGFKLGILLCEFHSLDIAQTVGGQYATMCFFHGDSWQPDLGRGAGRIQKRVLERGKEAVGYKSEALGEGRGRCLDTEAEELLPQGVDLEYHTGHVETSHLAEEAAADDVSGSEEGTGSSSSSGVSSGTAE